MVSLSPIEPFYAVLPLNGRHNEGLSLTRQSPDYSASRLLNQGSVISKNLFSKVETHKHIGENVSSPLCYVNLDDV